MTSQRPDPDIHSPDPPPTSHRHRPRRAAVLLVAALFPALAACQPPGIDPLASGTHPTTTAAHQPTSTSDPGTAGTTTAAESTSVEAGAAASATGTSADGTGADPTSADPFSADPTSADPTDADETNAADPVDLTGSTIRTAAGAGVADTITAARTTATRTITPTTPPTDPAPFARTIASTPAVGAKPAVTTTASAKVLQTGVTVFAMWRDAALADSLFAQARAAGSTWVRVDMAWCSVEEAGPGKVSLWYQNRLDAVVASAAAHGLRLLLEVSCTPAWARPGAAADAFPKDLAQYQRIMTYLSARYRGKVAAWEIWNEPDCIGGPCPTGSPAAYVPVLKAGFLGVRAGSPGTTVVSGGISGNNGDWIHRMYLAGAKGYFDALAVHPYMSPASASPAVASNGAQIYHLTNVAYIHYVMGYHGDGAKPIWFTEFGWTTATVGPNPGVNETTQATYLQQSIQQIQQQYPYVSKAFWFTMRDRDDSTPYENLFGLLHVNGSPKPSLAAFRSVNAWLARQ